ncbi:hypothetical protein TraAM80_10088 [Trypanosoma rangeli]|uniref:Uncharacterized protein n=1 Tax=Trypanosoma rangeli TaxID=5698 RepID=A0A3R7LXZ1_TRYRA|nr:uncharacterized protein TraAM80_10088 [Trypanosoma rangeli]RNE95790.1 hypothetical protein TraAM80_10088 [Trypanosoma rangeli]|eukprot:RNE95790.1 hypothetical protein TraAM80_10088 [Trypanosoma rangeli]
MLSGLTGGKAIAAATTAQKSGANRIIVIAFARWRGIFLFCFFGCHRFWFVCAPMGGAACTAESLEQTPLAPLFCWFAVLGACACSVLFGQHALTGQSEAAAALASPSLASVTKQQERGLHASLFLLFLCFHFYFFNVAPHSCCSALREVGGVGEFVGVVMGGPAGIAHCVVMLAGFEGAEWGRR